MVPLLILLASGLSAQRSLPPTGKIWAMKPAKPPSYSSPHKPHVRLSAIRAQYAGQADWRETVVNDAYLNAAYISMAPGKKDPRRFHPETRVCWVILDGEIRFTIEGAEPFVASKGSMVQVPLQTIYEMEAIGDRPALRVEVHIAGARTLYPRDAAPPRIPGMQWIPVKTGRRNSVWGEGNRPHITFSDLERTAKPDERGLSVQSFVRDDRLASNFIYGSEKDLAPLNPKDKGHYHPECSEFWLILAGQVRYAIEGQNVLIASAGDVVYVPPFTYHAPRFHGPAPACRLSFNGYPNILHLYEDAQ